MRHAPSFGGSSRVVTWSPEYGIARRHWDVFLQEAAGRYVIVVRTGKRAAIQWIEQGIPGKPRELGFLKVDPELGLLVARTADERRQVHDLGYYLLESVPPGRKTAGPPGGWMAVHPQHGQLPRVFHEPWARTGVVLDPHPQLPVTADYDLSVVIDVRELHYHQTLGSFSDPAHRTNPFTEAFRAQLDRKLGGLRIRHATQAQYKGDLGTRADEGVVAFCPDGRVVHFQTDVDAGSMQLRDLLKSLFPRQAHVFAQ